MMDKFLEELNKEVKEDMEIYLETRDEGLLKKIALRTGIIMNITYSLYTRSTTDMMNEITEKSKGLDMSKIDMNSIINMFKG